MRLQSEFSSLNENLTLFYSLALFSSANRVNLTVIPLVQTFGHAEWILKTALFEPLRENENYTNVSFTCAMYILAVHVLLI